MQILEARRLLIAQGESFEFTQTFDSSGLLGDISAQIRWGDGSSSAASSVIANSEPGNIKIRFDYRYDNGFFSGRNSHRRQLLQTAADTLTSRLQDELTAIVPTSNITWAVSIVNPTTGTPVMLPASPVIAANEIVVYAGARNLPTNVRGLGGNNITSIQSIYRGPNPCGTQAQCDAIQADIDAFEKAINTRGQLDTQGSTPTDFGPYIGTIAFDSDTIWYDDVDESGFPGDGQIDFLTVATHELAHVLGFGVAPSWQRIVQSGGYRGNAANAVYPGSARVPLENVTAGLPAHWNDSVPNVQRTLMTTTLNFNAGQRTELSELDFAALTDIGWEVTSADVTVMASHQFNVPGEFVPELVLTGSRNGQIVLPLDALTVTPVTQMLTASFAASQVREGASAGIELTVQRGDFDTSRSLVVTVSGGPAGQLNMPATVTIPANQSQHTIDVLTVDDDQAELSKLLTYTFTAANHETSAASITVLDDEPPLFQNPVDPFDVSGADGVRASDALRIVNELSRRLSPNLNPETETPNGVFYDVNGDYRITALDALVVINELPNRDSNGNREAIIDSIAQDVFDSNEKRGKVRLNAIVVDSMLF